MKDGTAGNQTERRPLRGEETDPVPARISAVLLTRDEESRIERCLRSLAWVDQILVVDTGSSDRTVSLARQFTEDIVTGDINRGFAYNRNLGNQSAGNDWILKVDADEVVTDELAGEIRRQVGREPGIRGYTAATRTYFHGRWIRGCGWYPMVQTRVFDRRHGTWEDLVHERLVLGGPTTRLRNDFLNFSYDDIQHYFTKFNLYTSLEALRLQQEGRRACWWNLPSLLFLRPAGFFLRSFILRRGWRDGFYGFLVSLFSSWYVMVKYMKLWERQRDAGTNNLDKTRNAV